MSRSNSGFSESSSRRNFLRRSAAAGVLLAAGSARTLNAGAQQENKKVHLCIFSKHLQWLDYAGMAETAAEAGFDGVEITVRPGGHVPPERVEDDLPKAVEAVKRAGIASPMITSGITDPNDPKTEKVLKTASEAGIGYYRLGYFRYREDASILKQLEELKPKLRDIAAMNAHYKIVGGQHNHSGSYFGASVWDQWEIIRDIDSPWLGYQHDIWHAWNEGRGGSWRVNSRLIAPRTKLLAIKTQAEWTDPAWRNATNKEQEKWESPTPDNVLWLLRLMKDNGFSGPVSTMYEYSPLGGAEHGANKLEGITPKELIDVFKKNLRVLRELLSEAGLDS